MSLSPELSEALRTSNELPPPRTAPMSFEVRTMCKIIATPQSEIDSVLNSLPGVYAAIVTWRYVPADVDAFVRFLGDFERRLTAYARPTAYLGTFRKFVSDSDTDPHFSTVWGLKSLADMATIGVFDDASLHRLFLDFLHLIDGPGFRQSIETLAVVSHDLQS